MHVFAHEVASGRFFATADPPPANVFVMCVSPGTSDPGLCQNIADESYWHIQGNRLVRLIREDEYGKTVFYVAPPILEPAWPKETAS